MKKSIVFILILFSGLYCHASEYTNNTIKLIYAWCKFNIPKNPDLIMESKKDINSSLIFTYGKDGGKTKYLGFDDLPENYFSDLSCSNETFLKDVFSDNKKSTCNIEKLESFSKIFFIYDNSKKGSFANGEIIIYSIIGNDRSFLFICKKNNKTIQVGSNFLSEHDLKNIIDFQGNP